MARRNPSKLLLTVGTLITIGGSLVGLSTGCGVKILINPAPGYKGPTSFDFLGIHLGVFLMTAIGSILALVGVLMSSKKRSARIFIGIGSLLILSHSVIGLLGYYDVLRIFPWLYREAHWNQPIVYTGLFNLTVFGLVALIIGGSVYSNRIMAFVDTYLK